jgi:hypothetical protein
VANKPSRILAQYRDRLRTLYAPIAGSDWADRHGLMTRCVCEYIPRVALLLFPKLYYEALVPS